MMKQKYGLVSEVFGWYGAIAILGAYSLISFGVISSSSIEYQLLNLTGAIGIIVIAIYKKVLQSVILNVFWAFVALIALINILL